MPRSLADIVAAPSWIKIGWRRLLFSPLTLRDWGLLDRWLRDFVVQAKVDAAGDDGLKLWQRVEVAWSEVAKSAVPLFDSEDEEVAVAILSVGFVVELVRLSLDHEHPGIGTRGAARVVKRCGDPEALLRFVLRISGAGGGAARPAEPEEGNGRRRRNRSELADAVAVLAGVNSWLPEEVARLTLPQLDAVMKAAAGGGSGIVSMPLREVANWRKRMRAERGLGGGN